jgi:hypothetical protein
MLLKMATGASSSAGGQVARKAATSTSKLARASPSRQIRQAVLAALANGLERYLPLGVGIIVVGVPLIAVAWLAHLLLGIPTWAASGVAGSGSIGYALTHFIRSG